jgi:hypothetical protein
MSLKLFDSGACAVEASTSFARARCGESLVERLQDLEGLINHLFASWLGAVPLIPSRRSHRLPNRQPVAVTPLDEASLEPNGVTQRVFAWDVSTGGLSFLHRDTLVCRTIAVTFQFEPGEFQSVLTRLKWCRFTRSGQYRSGGQFLRTIVSPHEAEVDFARLPTG